MIKWIFIFQVFIQCSLCAQQDSMDVIKVIGPEVSIAGVVSSSSSLLPRPSDNTAGDLLSRHNGIHLQTQGGPYLRTALYRGQSARHMAILWEGVNIQNSFNGTYDLGLIPSTIFSESKWYDGGQSAQVGTAAMSGALVLKDANNNKPLISAGIHYNDQNNRRINIGVQYGLGKLTQFFQANVTENENAFRYQSRDTIAKRRNSDHAQLDISYRATMEWSVAARTYLSYWYQDVDRILAPSTIATNQANQEDRNHRLSLGHDWQWTPKLFWSTKLAYMNEYIGFFQPGIESLAESNIVNLNSRINYSGQIDHTIGVAMRYEKGQLEDEANPMFDSFFPERTTSAIFYNGTTQRNKTTFSLSLRQEWIDTELQTPTGQLGIRYDQSNRLSYTLNVGRHYSYPGFNDLYWPTGGNLDLTTEKSWQIEGGFTFDQLTVKVYRINTLDKILWAPNEQNIWTPENVSSTSSLGFEIKYNREMELGESLSLILTPIVNFNHTINTAEGVNNGKELLYNPRLNYRLNTQLKYRQLSLEVNESYVGRRFQSLDNVSELEAYGSLDIELSYQWNSNNKYNSKIYLGAKNLLDQEFELVRFYPQPLLSIYIGAIFSIQ